MKDKIICFLSDFHASRKDISLSKNIENIIAKLPQKLCSELNSSVRKNVLGSFDIFNLFSQSTLDKLVYYIEDSYYMPK